MNEKVRFDQLIQFAAEYMQQGQKPKDEWLIEITQILTLHPEWNPITKTTTPPPPPPVVDIPRAAIPWRSGERVPIIITPKINDVVDEVLDVWGKRFCVFRMGAKLVEIQIFENKLPFLINEPHKPRFVVIDSVRARSLASRECSFLQEKITKDSTSTQSECIPPDWLGPAIVRRVNFIQIPEITALTMAPTLRCDGALIQESGYDESTGIYLTKALDVKVSNDVNQTEACLAMRRILDLVADFDFVTEAARSVWVAGVLSVAARHTFNGPVPMIIVDASTRGAGKSMLVDLTSVLTTGSKASRMFYTDDDDEMDKRILALTIAGNQIVLLDNIVGKIASKALDGVLTSDFYEGRFLGKSEMSTAVPHKIVWFATGNGLIIGADTARRAIFARLEPKTDRPEQRTGPRPGTKWRFPNLLEHVKEHREELLGYVLTIVKSYIQAGRPDMRLKPMGSFEAWSNTIRSAIVYAGGADPCETIAQAREADLQDHALRAMVECWPVADGIEVTANALVEAATIQTSPNFQNNSIVASKTVNDMWKNALLEWLPAKKGDLPTARELGYALRSIKGSIIGNYKIEAGEPLKSGVPWRRVRLDGISQPDFVVSEIPSLSLVK